MEKVLIKCEGKDEVLLEELTDLQGSFKILTEKNFNKLRNSLLKYGFSFPFFVYKEKGIKYVLDGHQRTNVLKKMKEQGFELPEKFPCIYVEAKNIKEARQKLLMLNSQFGEITEEGLSHFFTEYEIDFHVLDELHFESVNMGLFGTGHTTTDIETNIIKDEEELIKEKNKKFIECPTCGEKIEI
jgi:hypothetical protein